MEKQISPLEQFFEAAQDDDAQAVQKALLEHPFWAREKDIDGRTALMLAIESQSEPCAQVLLPVSNARARDDCGNTALIFAALSGRPEMVEKLLPLRDAGATGHDKMSAFQVAAWRKHYGCALLLAPFSDVNAFHDRDRTALMDAAYEGDVDFIVALLPMADARQADRYGQTALMFAAWRNKIDCVKALWPLSDPGALDETGVGALGHAKRAGSWGAADYLAAKESLARARALREETKAEDVALPMCEALIEQAELSEATRAAIGPDAASRRRRRKAKSALDLMARASTPRVFERL